MDGFDFDCDNVTASTTTMVSVKNVDKRSVIAVDRFFCLLLYNCRFIFGILTSGLVFYATIVTVFMIFHLQINYAIAQFVIIQRLRRRPAGHSSAPRPPFKDSLLSLISNFLYICIVYISWYFVVVVFQLNNLVFVVNVKMRTCEIFKWNEAWMIIERTNAY